MTGSIVSLFSGCGGLDAGFLAHGFAVLEAHDRDPSAVATYNLNFPPVARVSDLNSHLAALPKSDIIIAGPPCQGFSTIGNLKKDDERNSLLERACHIATTKRPSLFFLENVMGLTTVKNRPLLDKATALLSDAGYFVERLSLKGEDLGLPQKRRRILLVARRGKKPFNISVGESPRKTVRDALANVRSDKATLPQGSSAWLIALRIKPGQKLCNVRDSAAAVHTWDIPEVFGAVTRAEREVLQALLRLRRTERQRSFGDADPVSEARLKNALGLNVLTALRSLREKGYIRRVGTKYDLVHTFNGTYRRLKWDDLSPTVDTHFGDPRLFLHPEEHRGLAEVEAAALQGFEPEFRWPRGKSTYRLIGNAVPPPMSAALARIARELMR